MLTKSIIVTLTWTIGRNWSTTDAFSLLVETSIIKLIIIYNEINNLFKSSSSLLSVLLLDNDKILVEHCDGITITRS